MLADRKHIEKQTLSIHQVNCIVKENRLVNDDYRHLILDAPAEILDITPGQFFQLLCPSDSVFQPYLRRPMSIYGADKKKGELHFLYKLHGEGTKAMAGLKCGDNFNVVGPLGQGFSIDSRHKNLVVVARGVGLATLAPLADLAQQQGCKLTAICSARSPELLMSIDYFKSKGANIITLTDSEGTSGMDNIELILSQIIEVEGVDCIFTCGSKRIQKLLQNLSNKHSIPAQVALEQQMACGIGMCFCCVKQFSRHDKIVSERVCKEGPVFNLQEVLI